MLPAGIEKRVDNLDVIAFQAFPAPEKLGDYLLFSQYFMLSQRIEIHNSQDVKEQGSENQRPSRAPNSYFVAVPISQLTVRRCRPLALLDARTLRPFFVDILNLNPCLFLLFLLLG